MKKRLFGIVTAVMLILCLSGCFRIPYLMPTNSSRQVEQYLEEKYGGHFRQARSGMYTRGDNSADYWYYEESEPEIVFNVYDDDGELSDDYEAKKILYRYAETIEDQIGDMGGEVLMHPAKLFNEEADIPQQEIFCYLVINEETVSLDAVRSVLEENAPKNERCQTVAVYTMNGADFADLKELYGRIYSMNDTYAGQYDSTRSFSFVYENGASKWYDLDER